jgi:cytochrome c oxidase subunit 3
MSVIKNKTFKQLLWVGMGAIAMFFAGLTSAYIVRKAEGNWNEFILPEWFWYSTLTIVLSSALLFVVKYKIKKDQSVSALLFSVFVLGLLFSYSQLNGWKELASQGVFLTGEGSNVAGSFLYVITLSHLVHLIGGLVALLITAINAMKGRYNAVNYLGVELASIYWHFLSVLWIYLFFFLKYL